MKLNKNNFLIQDSPSRHSLCSMLGRGAETNERSEFGEVEWWNKIEEIHHPGLCLVTFGDSPESTPPVQELSCGHISE